VGPLRGSGHLDIVATSRSEIVQSRFGLWLSGWQVGFLLKDVGRFGEALKQN